MGKDAQANDREPAPQLRLDSLLGDLQDQVQRVRETRDRVHTLLEAVLAMGGDLDLEAVLRRIVQSAVSLVDAEYGALGVLGEEGGITQFITVGMDEQAIARIGHYPQGLGILGLLIREPHSLRLTDIGAHPDSSGFPAGHPPMRTFVGAPVRVRERVFGNLYLTGKRGGAEFEAEDEMVLRTLATAAGVAIDNARLYDGVRHRERRLAASGELTRALLSGADPADILRSLAATVQSMTGAALVVLAVPVGDSGDLVVETSAGRDAERAQGLVLPVTTPAAKVFASGERVAGRPSHTEERIGDGGTVRIPSGPYFVVPLGTAERVRGVLQVAAAPDGQEFPESVLDMVGGFADQAALALEIAEHRRDAENMMLLTDRDRIARDLHELVIQRLFANGLTLQAALARLLGPPDSARRIQQVLDDLDGTINVIRSTVYALRTPQPREDGGLRAKLLAETDRAAEALGFAPALRMTGLLETLVPRDIADQLIAVLSEALSNAVRHARATGVDVTAEATGTTVTLRVADNGHGIGTAATRHSGLAGLRTRAEALGGTFTVTPNEPTGTVLEWTVPLPADTGVDAGGVAAGGIT
ncbi:GAF sensor signal transduction histidine kinase [Actinobacteria bacterium OK074]|nr:GAF sensor signal transduction histidine kinase [Actinobacteria bacterium OK074]